MDKEIYNDIINILIIIYVALPLLFLLLTAILHTIGEKLKKDTWTTIVNFSKWYLPSVAIVLAGKMIESGFKERETGIKEMKTYNEYTHIVLNTDSVEQLYALTRYFAYVTPTERLRNRWRDYLNVIEPEYKTLIADKKRADSITAIINDVTKGMYQLTEKNMHALKDSQKAVQARISNVKTAFPVDMYQKISIVEGDVVTGRDWERKGFEALLNKDVHMAIAAFKNADKAISNLHNAHEIWQYLIENKDTLATGKREEWDKLYKTLLKEYSWGMPLDVKKHLEERTDKKTINLYEQKK